MKITMNESNMDRTLRVIVGLTALYLGLGGILSGVLAIIAIVFGLMLLTTGLLGYCPAYSALKISTKKAEN